METQTIQPITAIEAQITELAGHLNAEISEERQHAPPTFPRKRRTALVR